MFSIEKTPARTTLCALVLVSACSLQDFGYLQSGSAGAGGGGASGANSSGGKLNMGGGESTGGSVHDGGAGGSTPIQAGAGGEAAGAGGAGEAGAANGGTSSGGAVSGGTVGTTGGEAPGGAGGNPETGGGPPIANLLVNPSFEAGLTNWVVDPKEAVTNRYVYVQYPTSGGTTKDGSQELSTWHESAEYQLTVSQVVTKLVPGKYTFKGWFSSTQSREAFIFARNCGTAEQDVTVPALTFEWFEITIPEIVVTGTSCEVGLYVHGAKPEGLMPDWLNADMFTFEWVAPP